MEPPAIDAVELAKTYPGDDGLRRLDLQVPRGTLVGLIGPSGAGKTTVVRLVTGLLGRDSGDLSVLGEDPDRFGTATRARIGYLPQDTVLYPRLSVRENLDFVAATYGLWGRRRAEARTTALDLVDLTGLEQRRLADLSGGQRRRAALAATLLHGADLLVLDEPTAGQDPILRQRIWQTFEHLGESGATILVTTQHVDEAAYCDVVVFLGDGELIAQGSPDQLRRDAFGGELVDVEFDTPQGTDVVAGIGDSIGAKAIHEVGRRTVRYVVDDASSAIPAITATADCVSISGIDRYQPDFDETFVRLAERSRP